MTMPTGDDCPDLTKVQNIVKRTAKKNIGLNHANI